MVVIRIFKSDIPVTNYEAGLKSSPWQHIDDTSTRVNGQNQYCQILCNPLYAAYFTTKD